MKLDQATIDRLKAEHPGELHKVTAIGETYVMRTPSRAEWRRYQEQAREKRGPAQEALVRHCVVWPGAAELDAAIEKKPGLVDVLALKAVEFACAAEEATHEKL
jgi:hypothetical protein